MKTLEEHYVEFKGNGFTILPKVFDQAQIDEWISLYPSLIKRQTLPGADQDQRWLSSVVEYEPHAMLPAVTNEKILDFAEMVMGPFVQLDNLTFMAFPSLSKEEANGKISGWHRDQWSSFPLGNDYIWPKACNAICYLQDLTDDNGPFRVIPGSHRAHLSIEEDNHQKKHRDEKIYYPSAGDVVFTHCGVVHSGTPNTSGKLRYFFSIYYNLSWLRHRDNHSGPNVAKIIAMARKNNDRRLLRLFGIDELVFPRSNWGFRQPDNEKWVQWIKEDREALKK